MNNKSVIISNYIFISPYVDMNISMYSPSLTLPIRDIAFIHSTGAIVTGLKKQQYIKQLTKHYLQQITYIV